MKTVAGASAFAVSLNDTCELSEGGCEVVYPLGLWFRFSGVVDLDMASKLFTFTFTCAQPFSQHLLCTRGEGRPRPRLALGLALTLPCLRSASRYKLPSPV